MAQQIRDAVLDLIRRDGLRAGDRLPTEAALCEAFAISRPSLREALRLLEQEGQIVTQHGRGRFLSAAAALTVARPISTYESISAMLAALGYDPVTQVLSVHAAPTSDQPEASAALDLPDGDEVVIIERLRSDGTGPLVYSVAVIPAALLGDDRSPETLAGSLNDILGGRGHRPVMSTANAAAVLLPEGVAAAIGAMPGAPWLLVTETCLTTAGLPVLFARDYHRGDAISFNLTRR